MEDDWILGLRRFGRRVDDVERKGCRNGGTIVTLKLLLSFLALSKPRFLSNDWALTWPTVGRNLFVEDAVGFKAMRDFHFWSGGSSNDMDIHGRYSYEEARILRRFQCIASDDGHQRILAREFPDTQ